MAAVYASLKIDITLLESLKAGGVVGASVGAGSTEVPFPIILISDILTSTSLVTT